MLYSLIYPFVASTVSRPSRSRAVRALAPARTAPLRGRDSASIRSQPDRCTMRRSASGCKAGTSSSAHRCTSVSGAAKTMARTGRDVRCARRLIDALSAPAKGCAPSECATRIHCAAGTAFNVNSTARTTRGWLAAAAAKSYVGAGEVGIRYRTRDATNIRCPAKRNLRCSRPRANGRLGGIQTALMQRCLEPVHVE